MTTSLIEVVAAPELGCDAWTAACTAVPHGSVEAGHERTNWAAADQTHTALRLWLSPGNEAGVAGATSTERYEVEEIEVGAAPPAPTPVLYLVRMDVDPAAEQEFNEWYTTDHVANLGRVPGVHSARRFRALNAGPHVRRYLALYYLDCPGVRQTAHWQRAAHTDWSISIRTHHRRKLATLFVPTGPGFVHSGRRAAT